MLEVEVLSLIRVHLIVDRRNLLHLLAVMKFIGTGSRDIINLPFPPSSYEHHKRTKPFVIKSTILILNESSSASVISNKKVKKWKLTETMTLTSALSSSSISIFERATVAILIN